MVGRLDANAEQAGRADPTCFAGQAPSSASADVALTFTRITLYGPISSLLTVFAGIAEFERSLIGERTSSGRKAAHDRGVRFGRSSAWTPEQVALGRRLIDEGKSVREVARGILKCHPATSYRELAKAVTSAVQ